VVSHGGFEVVVVEEATERERRQRCRLEEKK